MGKAIASEAINRKNDYNQSGHPDCRCLTRHAVSLPPPQMQRFPQKDKIDLLMEGYLIYGETLEQGAHRIFTTNASHRPIRPFALQLHVSF